MRIGIDLGGTKIEGIVMDKDANILARKRVATPAAQGYSKILETIVEMVHTLENQAHENCTIGIGTPGALSSDNRSMKNANTLCLNGKPMQTDLENMLERDIRLENDANCFTLSEACDGAAREFETVFGVIMGTGVGGGIVIHKRLHSGPQHIAGEWGHNILVPQGAKCYCGRKGCVETYLSGPALTRQWREHTGDATVRTVEQIIGRAQRGDELAETVLQRYFDYFGQALSSVINILDPDAIVLGGGMSNIDGLYTAGRQRVAEYVFNDQLTTPILRNHHGDSSGVRGAARLWPDV